MNLSRTPKRSRTTRSTGLTSVAFAAAVALAVSLTATDVSSAGASLRDTEAATAINTSLVDTKEVSAFDFDYVARSGLIADGWNFQGRTGRGFARNTEQFGTVTYSVAGMRIPAGSGDLWQGLNNTRNSLFRALPASWTSTELDMDFAPQANYQQAGVAVYADDDNYVQLTRNFHSSFGGQSVAFITEQRGVATEQHVTTRATSIKLRLTRDGSVVRGSFSTDAGRTWTSVGTSSPTITQPRLGIIVGANESAGTAPVATMKRATVTAAAVDAPTVPPTPTETPSATPSPTPTATPSPTATPTAAPSPTPTASPSATPSPTPTATPSPTPTPAPTPAPTFPGAESGGTLPLNYSSRSEFVSDGWTFQARSSRGSLRNTEQTGAVSYSSAGLRIPGGPGDLWQNLNNTRNSVFRDLPSAWTSAAADVDFAPQADYQQAGIVAYTDDDNYVQITRNFHTSFGGNSVAFITEHGGTATEQSVATDATSITLRISRAGNTLSGDFSTDSGKTWKSVGSSQQSLSQPQLGIIVGANESGGAAPAALVRQVAVTTPDTGSGATPTASPTPRPTPTAGPTAAPTPSVTSTPTPVPTPEIPREDAQLDLPTEAWWGGPSYYGRFEKATKAGWTDPNFFPLAVFFGKPGHATQLAAAGINTYMGAEHDGSPISAMTGKGISVLAQGEWTPAEVGNDPLVVGWHVSDECDMGYSECTPDWNQDNGEYGRLAVQKSYVDEYRSYNDGRFMQANFGNGVLGTWWAPNTMPDHVGLVDVTSVDKYAYTSPHVNDLFRDSSYWPAGKNPASAGAYGWQQDRMETFASPAGSKPNWVFVETAKPYLTEDGARSISGDQIEGAVWNAIIHGASGIAYFQHNNNGECGNYSIVECSEGLKSKIQTVNASVKSLASVINTPSYRWTFGSGLETALKAKDGYAYIFAMTDGGSGARTFTLPAGMSGVAVEVVGENRTIPIRGNVFNDSFSAEHDHHIYRVALTGD